MLRNILPLGIGMSRFPRFMTTGERVLVSTHSAYNKILLTEDAAGLRTLRFGSDGAFQSVVKAGDPEHLELPYASVLPACLVFVQKPLRMLVIGLGGGTIPSFFHHRLPETFIDVVEIDEVVVDVAKSHCGFVEDGRMHVYVEDGRDFVENCRGRYDIIILDSFDSHSIPQHLATSEFLQAVREALTPNGIAVANVWGRSLNRLYDDMLLTYRHVFDDVYIFDVPAPGTKIFVALPRKQSISRAEVLQLSRQISRDLGLRQDISDTISGFRNAEEEHRRGGAILKD